MLVKALKDFFVSGRYHKKDEKYYIDNRTGQTMIKVGNAISMRKVIFVCPECLLPARSIVVNNEIIKTTEYSIDETVPSLYSEVITTGGSTYKSYIFLDCNHKVLETMLNPHDYLVITNEETKRFEQIGAKLVSKEKELKKLFFGDIECIKEEPIKETKIQIGESAKAYNKRRGVKK